MKLNGIDYETYFNNYPDKDGYFGKYGGVYVDDKLKAENKKSVAYTLTFRNKERTLTDNEVNAAMDKLRSRLVADLKFELR